MNSSHATAAGIVGMLTAVLVWLSHWPLKPLDDQTAASLAGLIVAAIALLPSLKRQKQNPSSGGGNGGAPSSTDSATKP